MSSGREGKKREERSSSLAFSFVTYQELLAFLKVQQTLSAFTALHLDPSSVEEVSLFCSEQREVENG